MAWQTYTFYLALVSIVLYRPRRRMLTHTIVHLIARWGYKFVDLVAALQAHSATCSEPPFFFLDTMAINQHDFALGSTGSQAVQSELLEGLRSSLRASGKLLLVCMAGPGDDPGWMAPAPFKRIWCLYEAHTYTL